MSTNTVSDCFWPHTQFKVKQNIHSFIEQVNLYQMVYGSIKRIKKFQGEKIQLLIWYHTEFCEKYMKNAVSEQYSSLIISASERFQKMAYIQFDAELYGLQTSIKHFLAIDFSHTRFIEILKTWAIFRCENLMYFDSFAWKSRWKENATYTVL